MIDKNFSGQDFSGQDLSNRDFSYSIIKGTNFKNANLEKANFSGAQAGLQAVWKNSLVILISLLTILLIVILEILSRRTAELIIFTNFKDNPETIGENIWTAIIILIIIGVFVFQIRKGIEEAFKSTATAGILFVCVSFIHIFIQSLLGVISRDNVTSITGYFTRFMGRSAITSVTGIGICLVAVAIAIGILIVQIAHGNTAKKIVIFTAWLIIVPTSALLYQTFIKSDVKITVFISAIIACIVVYISQIFATEASKTKKEFAIIFDIAVNLASIGGTSFQGAILTDANFSEAFLKNTNFQGANITRTYWRYAKGLNFASGKEKYLSNPLLIKLVVNGDGKNENLDNHDLRELNFSKFSFENASFVNTNLYQANLSEANLSEAFLVRTQLESTDLTNATLTGACIEDWLITKTTKLDNIECKYIYMKHTENGKDDRMPRKNEFKSTDFINFITSIQDTIKLYHNGDVNPQLAMHVLQSLSRECHTTLEITKLERKQEGVIIELKIPGLLNQEIFKETYYERYSKYLELFVTDPEGKLNPIEKTIIHNGIIMGNYNENIEGNTIMTGERKINTGGGNYNERIQGDYVEGNYYAGGEPQSLAQAAGEIQQLLKQLEQTYPTTTTSQQMVVAAEAIKHIESNPSLKKRAINAAKEGGLAAFEKAIDNPAGAFIVNAIKGWQEVE